MTAALLAAWWGPLIPVGMVVVAVLYGALQAAARRKSWAESLPPPPAPQPDPRSWGGGSPFPRPLPLPGIPPLTRAGGPPAGSGAGRPAPLPAFPPLPPVLASLSEESPADPPVDSPGPLEARVQAQMHQVDLRMQRPVATPVPERAPRNSPAVASLIRRLQSPATAREAWVSAMVFAPPRSLE